MIEDTHVVESAIHLLGKAAIGAKSKDRVIAGNVSGLVGGGRHFAIDVQYHLGAVVNTRHMIPSAGLQIGGSRRVAGGAVGDKPEPRSTV